ncbi:OmpA family protein [Seonamhaeicola sp. NFXS20]|uniref:OmpA family protein n=1 Tax=Seonamhaeicola sp. NFXS20 TaxID=2816959 RepID=UPI003B8D8CC2
MKNNISITIFSIIFFGMFWLLPAQDEKLDKATERYSQMDYVEAQKIYLSVAEKGYESEELFTKLGNTYYFNAQYDEAAKWYRRLFKLNPEQEANLLLRYSQSLRAIGNLSSSKKYYDAYVSKRGGNLQLNQAIDYLSLIEENSGRYKLHPIEAIYNDDHIAFGHTQVGDTLIYSSTEDINTVLNKRSAWDGLSFLSLYEVEIDTEGNATGKPRKIKGTLNSKYHESSAVYTKDGTTMYFTRSNLTYKNKNNDQNLKVYRSVKKNGKWQEPKELHFNSDDYSCAHPALNADETKLYFSSNRPGGYGESDLYVANIASNGTIGAPKNLGPKINTSGKETFPFVSKSNELYFSSDGHFGLGGLDVFYVKIEDDGYGNLLNVGRPVNTYADDFSFGIDSETKRGFISSNRTDTEGHFVRDNIYTFVETAPIKDVYKALIEGYVTDKQTSKPISGTTITLRDSEGNIYKVLNTDKSGYYSVEANKYHTYAIRATHNMYDTDEKISETGYESQRIDFQLQKNRAELVEGTDLAKVLNIPIIYFDFDKSNIRPDAAVELEKVVTVLQEYPELRINIRSHTDSRGTDSYNLILSEKRAASTLNYLVSKGISRNRLQSEGLGETEPVNGCSNGAPCTKAEHQKNRRSEFIVIK